MQFYRGYYFDDESGLYYLKSRYYNPEWGRFISADAFADTGQGVIATNMYAYCENNAVNRVDYNGNSWEEIKTSFRNLYNGAKSFCERVFGFGNCISFSSSVVSSVKNYGIVTVVEGTKIQGNVPYGNLNKPINFFTKTSFNNSSISFGAGYRLIFSKRASFSSDIGFGINGVELSTSFQFGSVSKDISLSLNMREWSLNLEIADAIAWDTVSGVHYTSYSIDLLPLALSYATKGSSLGFEFFSNSDLIPSF